MAHHQLKIWPEYYAPVAEGLKLFEIRQNDRGFQKGDTVELLEWEPGSVTGKFTGRSLYCQITYVTGFGQKENWVVFGIKIIRKKRKGSN